MSIEKEVIGDATVYCGDCRELWGEVGSKCVDLLLTDPPYGIDNNNPNSMNFRCNDIFRKETPKITGDRIKGDVRDDFLPLFDDFLTAIKPLMADKSTCLCFCSGGAQAFLAIPYFANKLRQSAIMATNSFRL